MESYDQLRASHRGWVEESFETGNSGRESMWTESIAVGSLAVLPLLAALSQIAWPRQAFFDSVTDAIFFLLISIFFFGFLIFLDTKYFVSRIRKALLSM